MINQFFQAVQQLAVFSLIPFIVYLVQRKTTKGFFDYIGLKSSTRKANLIAAGLSLFSLLGFLLLTQNPEFMKVMKNPKTVTGQLFLMGFTPEAVGILIVVALFKTSFTEEVLFRGFIAKRLASVVGFRAGNIIQSLIFGIIHFALFLGVTQNIVHLTFIFLWPTAVAYVIFYINEKMANGSIIPGWIAHGLGNLISYTIVCFMI